MSEREKSLFGTVKEKAYDYGIGKQTIPEYIGANLRHGFWFWQKEALENFLIQEKIREVDKDFEPTHLMFHMATGTGKTMIMASLLLYYYYKGYRHFIFFVHQNNIIDKTENNFIHQQHAKYLFQKTIVINDQTVKIRKVLGGRIS